MSSSDNMAGSGPQTAVGLSVRCVSALDAARDGDDNESSSDGIESRVDGVEVSITNITATPIAGGNVIVTIPGRNGDPLSLTELSKAGFEAFKTSQGVF